MAGRTTVLLLVLVAALGGAYWWWEARPAHLAQRAAQAQARLRLRPERVTEVTLQRGAESWILRRVDNEWRLVEPLLARADAGEVDRLLTQIGGLLPGQKIIAAEEAATLDLGDYGLFPPQSRLQWEQDGQRRVVQVGQRTLLGPQVYVRWADQPGIWTVPDRLLDLWPETLDDLRDRLCFLGDPQRVYRVDVRRRDGFLQLVKDAVGTWRLAQPFTGLANRGAIREWLEQLFAMRIERFVAEAVGEGGIYGLGEDALQITVWVEGRDEGQSMAIGQPVDGEGEQVYAQRRTGGSVFTVPAALASLARVPTDDLRDRTLVTLPPATIQAIRLTEDRETVVALEREHETERWWVTSPARWPADQERVEKLLAAWSNARIARFHETAPEPDAETEDKAIPEKGIQFVGWNGEDSAVTLRWKEEAVTAETRRVTRNDAPQALAIAAQPIIDTVWDPLYYRQRQVFDIAPASVRSVTQTLNGQEWSFTQERSGEWRPPEGLEELPLHFDQIMEALLQLTVVEFVKDPLENEADYGLDTPQTVWTVGLSADAGIARTLMLGANRSDGGVYARTRGQRALLGLDETTAKMLLAPAYPAPDESAIEDGL